MTVLCTVDCVYEYHPSMPISLHSRTISIYLGAMHGVVKAAADSHAPVGKASLALLS